MSASGRMAKKVELRRKWEDSLKDYQEPILYTRSVITWQRPIDLGVLLVAIAISFWLYTTVDYTLVTIVSLGIVSWAVLSWLILVTAFKFPWHLVIQSESANNVDHFGEVVAFFVQVKFALVDAIEELQRFKAANPNRFVLQIVVSGLLVAWLGSFLSGQLLLITIIYSLLLLPGALANGVPARVATLAEPHVKVYRERAGVVLSSLIQQVDQQINKAKNPQHTTSATTTTITETTVPSSPPIDATETDEVTSKKDE